MSKTPRPKRSVFDGRDNMLTSVARTPTGRVAGIINAPVWSGSDLPRFGLLVYVRSPNSDGVLYSLDQSALGVDIYPDVGAGFWFDDGGIGIPKTATEILQMPGINETYAFFSQYKGLAVYVDDLTLSAINAVRRYFGYSAMAFVPDGRLDEFGDLQVDESGNLQLG